MKNSKKMIACLCAGVFAASAMGDNNTSATGSNDSIRSNECIIQFDGNDTIRGHEYIQFATEIARNTLQITKVTINENALSSAGGSKDVTLVIPGSVNGNRTSIGNQAFANLNSKNLNLKVRFENTGDTKVRLDNCSDLFKGSKSITEINLNGADSSGVTSAQRMFCGCCKLKSVNFGSFDTHNIEDMSYMFQGCSALDNLDLSTFKTEHVSNMKQMFYACVNLKKLDLSKFDTRNLTDTSYMFYNCIRLTDLDVSNFDVSKVTNMSWMFSNCESIKELNLNSFYRINGDVFQALNLNEDLRSANSEVVEELIDSERTFKASKSKIEIDVEGMFYGCKNLKTLDLCNFYSKICNGNNMFRNCSNLRELLCPLMIAEKLTYYDDVFKGCDKRFEKLLKELQRQRLEETGRPKYLK